MSILEQLLGDASRDAFLRSHFLQTPFARAGGCQAFTAAADWDALGRLLARQGVDVIVGREGEAYRGPVPRSLAEAKTLLAAGMTIGVRHAERHHEGLAALAAGFGSDFAAPVNVHLYATPGETPGFGWHYDAEDVFVLQTEGSKEWWLRKNTVNPWPLVETLPEDMRYEREIMPVMRCRLAAGDWLYIPAGYWHRTAAGEASLSLSIGLLPATALDLFDSIRAGLVDSLLWRQRLPPVGAASHLSREQWLAAVGDASRELAGDVVKRLADPQFLGEFYDRRADRR